MQEHWRKTNRQRNKDRRTDKDSNRDRQTDKDKIDRWIERQRVHVYFHQPPSPKSQKYLVPAVEPKNRVYSIFLALWSQRWPPDGLFWSLLGASRIPFIFGSNSTCEALPALSSRLENWGRDRGRGKGFGVGVAIRGGWEGQKGKKKKEGEEK